MEGGETDRGREEILAGYVTYLYYTFPSSPSVGGRGMGDYYVSTVFSIFLFPYRYRCLQCKDFDMCQVSENETKNVVLKQKRIRTGGLSKSV